MNANCRAHCRWLTAIFAVGCAAAAVTPHLLGAIAYRCDGSGVFREARPVTTWDVATGRNVLWKIDFADWGHSLPIVVGDRLFITTEPQWLYCIDAAVVLPSTGLDAGPTRSRRGAALPPRWPRPDMIPGRSYS